MFLGDASGIGQGWLETPSVPVPRAPTEAASFGATSGGPVYAVAVYDAWGLLQLPAAPPPTDAALAGAAADPALWIYLNYLKAYLQTDGNLAALWNAKGVAPGKKVVEAVRPWNPSDDGAEPFGLGITTRDLPALYMWRKGGGDSTKLEWIAEDWLLAKTEVKLLWVFPLQVEPTQRARQTFADAVAKAVIVAIERGRTPGYVVPNDPDPLATALGSFVHTFTNAFSFEATHYGPARVRVTMVGDKGEGASQMPFAAVEMTFELQENLEQTQLLWTAPSRLRQEVDQGSVTAYATSDTPIR